ncbi:hypothetical protein EYM_07530 [Ignicoccus islandicus DSM 13165]|uniref:Uncharacterized protein n=1 Tax=Ignicoccus islandicus DSM 13165 TaxID=940295 RepID=A0A0U3FTH9_9CREN|nr:hypothetical protein [Ignicoccus islandicus]ALU12784.1 hypothetical protein EYM_07530 [Ignicoccus islandicus DSM 13165]
MILCELVPITVSLIYYGLRLRKLDPLKITLVEWVTIAAVASIGRCETFLSRMAYERIENLIVGSALEIYVKIFTNNFLVLTLTALLKELYLGYVITITALVARHISKSYPLSVILGAHTILELYAYALALKGSKRSFLKGILYLLIAAFIETYFISVK